MLALYSEANAACKSYIQLATSALRKPVLLAPFDDQPHGMPWLYWGLVTRESSSLVYQRIPNLSLTITDVTVLSSLQFVVGIYLLNGTFLGYQNLDSQLLACNVPTAVPSWNRPGQTVLYSCSVNIFSSAQSASETLFYDLFVQTKTGTLYPVPVRLINYIDSLGVEANADSQPTDQSKLFRRFTWIDTATGIKGGTLQYIRIPTSIKFWFKTVPKADGLIYLPVMDITYTERVVSELSATDLSSTSTPTFTFETHWSQDYSSYYQAMTILGALAGSLAFIAAIYQSKSWGSRNVGPGDTLDINVPPHIHNSLLREWYSTSVATSRDSCLFSCLESPSTF